jgi:putative aldouronate transport system substrate-binding protein
MKLTCIFALFFMVCGSVLFGGGNRQGGQGAVQSAASGEKYPAYINYDSTFPIMKEGQGGDVVLSVTMAQNTATSEWSKLWISKFVEKYLNLKLKVEQIPVAGLAERRNLIFAANDLPDMMLNMAFTGSDFVKYGQISGQLLRLDNYIDEKLTPDIIRRFNEVPLARTVSIVPDGHIYGLPNITPTTQGQNLHWLNINSAWLRACDLSTPRTLDEFLNVLRTFKNRDPSGVGSSRIIPLGGGSMAHNPGYYILNALGFVTPAGGSNGDVPSVRNGEAVIPCGDPLFEEYLRIMHTLYTEGLISSNFFVMDDTELRGQLVNGQIGIYPDNRVDTAGIPNWREWEACYPLTSSYSPRAVWKEPMPANIGNFAASAKTKYPQAVLRFANAYFSVDSRILWVGPPDGSEYAMGYMGRKVDASDASVSSKTFDQARFPAGIRDNWTYVMAYLGDRMGFGAIDMYDSTTYYHVKYHGGRDISAETLDPTFADHYSRLSAVDHVLPYTASGFPDSYYIDEDTTTRLSDLEAVIKPYVEEQVANFISGNRPLSEFGRYQQELKSIGFDELQNIYKKIWENFKAAQK